MIKYLLTLLLLGGSVLADVDTLRPVLNGVISGQVDKIGTCSGGDEYECIDEVTADDDDGYAKPGSFPAVDTFVVKIEPGSVPDGATINSYTIHYRAKKGSVTFTIGLTEIAYLPTSYSVGSNENTTTSYANYSGAVSKPGGGSWTVSDINDTTQAGLFVSNTGGIKPWGAVTQLFVVVDYTPAAASYTPGIMVMRKR